MRRQSLRELHGIRAGKVRPFGAFEAGELGIIFEVNAGDSGFLEEARPWTGPRCTRVLELLELTVKREADENDLSATRPKLGYGGSGVLEPRFDCLAHACHKSF